MFTTLKQSINEMNAQELEAISLAETLSLEEALCDVASDEFVNEATSTDTGRDMPADGSFNASEFAGDAESLQFYNQEQIPGMDDEDMDDMANPDIVATRNVGALAEGASLVSYFLGEDADVMTKIPDLDKHIETDKDIGEDLDGSEGTVHDEMDMLSDPSVNEDADWGSKDFGSVESEGDLDTDEFSSADNAAAYEEIPEGEDASDDGEEDDGDSDEGEDDEDLVESLLK